MTPIWVESASGKFQNGSWVVTTRVRSSMAWTSAICSKIGPVRLEFAVVLDVLDDGVAVERLTVVERDVGAELDGPLRVVVVGGEALGQVRLDLAVFVEAGQRVEDRVGHEQARR